MSEVDLNDLKINHGTTGKKARFPVLIVILLFPAGLVVGYLAADFWPLSNEETVQKDPVAAVGNNPVNPEPEEPEPESFTEGGWIEVPSYHPVVVSSLIPGRLDELLVLEGSRVKKGDVIARLYEKDLTDALRRAEAEAGSARANMERLKAGFRVQEVEKARADLAALDSDVTLKKKILERTRSLLSSGAVSREDLDRDEAACKTSLARRNALEQELLLKEEGSRVEDIEAAEADYNRSLADVELARNQLSYATVTSPFDGAVLERFVTPGTWIAAQNPRIVSLYDPNDLQVRVDVRQENIGGVFVGQTVEVFTDAELDRAYEGRVIRLEPMADFKKNTIQVKVKIHAPSENLYPEMIARIRFMRKNNDSNDGQD